MLRIIKESENKLNKLIYLIKDWRSSNSYPSRNWRDINLEREMSKLGFSKKKSDFTLKVLYNYKQRPENIANEIINGTIKDFYNKLSNRDVIKTRQESDNDETIYVDINDLAYSNNWSENQLYKYIVRNSDRFNISFNGGYDSENPPYQVGQKEDLIKWLKTLKFDGNIEEIYQDAKNGKLKF